MSTDERPRIVSVNPAEAWGILQAAKDSVLIDVRTSAEWTFVGVPDLGDIERRVIFTEWALLPEMSRNPDFVEAVIDAMGSPLPEHAFFLCRSGVRSMHAAHAVSARMAEMGHTATCYNVEEGFEGDLDSQGHRGLHAGWKARGLAWRQS